MVSHYVYFVGVPIVLNILLALLWYCFKSTNTVQKVGSLWYASHWLQSWIYFQEIYVEYIFLLRHPSPNFTWDSAVRNCIFPVPGEGRQWPVLCSYSLPHSQHPSEVSFPSMLSAFVCLFVSVSTATEQDAGVVIFRFIMLSLSHQRFMDCLSQFRWFERYDELH
jgi:hypothetical protein